MDAQQTVARDNQMSKFLLHYNFFNPARRTNVLFHRFGFSKSPAFQIRRKVLQKTILSEE